MDYVSSYRPNFFSDFNPRQLIAQLVVEFGNSTSLAVLDPICDLFHIPEVFGVIGYRLKFGYAIVFGDPICEDEDMPKLVKAFHDDCKKKGKKVIYTASSEKFSNWAFEHCFCQSSIKIGEEVILDPQYNYLKGRIARKLRLKIHQPERAGVTIHEFHNNDELIKKQIEEAAFSWLQARQGPQMFLSHLQLFDASHGRRWFYAEHEGKITGVLLLNELKKFQGWLVNFIATRPDAVKGTSELLIVQTLKVLKTENYHFLTIGTIPGEHLTEIKGIGFIAKLIAKVGFNFVKKIFKLDGKRRFWKKFQPQFKKNYVLIEKKHVGLKEILAIVFALNGKF